ncbi:hypothetical protein G6F57_020830 [Rhizopus arrhizus]|nr:hypothetical protein G6F57_020830 [Rhizopus arrhizus]
MPNAKVMLVVMANASISLLEMLPTTQRAMNGDKRGERRPDEGLLVTVAFDLARRGQQRAWPAPLDQKAADCWSREIQWRTTSSGASS